MSDFIKAVRSLPIISEMEMVFTRLGYEVKTLKHDHQGVELDSIRVYGLAIADARDLKRELGEESGFEIVAMLKYGNDTVIVYR